MKRVLFLLVVCAIAFGAFAQDDTEATTYAYVKASGVNLRTKPSTSSAIGAKASIGNIYPVLATNGEWIQVEVAEGPESNYYWLSSKFVDILKHKGFPENKLSSRFSYEKGKDFGMLNFKKIGNDEYDNTKVSFHYTIKNSDLQATGGNGIVLNKSGEILYIGTGSLLPPEGWEDSPIVYDREKGLLYFCGILWKEE